MADFLLEIGTEEIPAGMIRSLAEGLQKGVLAALATEGLAPSESRIIAAPRRVGFLLQGLPARQDDRRETVVGPALAIARDGQGTWTKAAEGFAKKQGIATAQLREVEGPKGLCVGFEREVKGRPTAAILGEVVPAAVEALYLPKAMKWGAGDFVFVRPVRWVVALLDTDIVPMTLKGAPSGRTGRGRRVFGAESVEMASVGEYFVKMEDQFVLADPEARKASIRAQLDAEAHSVRGHCPPDEELLDTVTFLCEGGFVLVGHIPERFLTLPAEVMKTCLREHQKFFVVLDDGGKALPYFLSVVDSPADPKGHIRRGNENVTVARLTDAEFFFEHDKAVPLEKRLEDLKGVVFHPKLGTYYDKAVRVEALALKLAAVFGANAEQTAWAARHCKCDLVSLLVQEKEFTSLQGIAGGLYAAAQGQPDETWKAIYDHYRPESTEDDLPRGLVGACVALADKLDTLLEMFRIGQAPTGSKDPFALRRAGMGVIRVLVEKGLPLDLPEFLGRKNQYGDLLGFLEGRLSFYWQEHGYLYDEVEAVLGRRLSDPPSRPSPGDPFKLTKKLKDFHRIRAEYPADFEHLAVAHKRARNITRSLPVYAVREGLFVAEGSEEGYAERVLWSEIKNVEKVADGYDLNLTYVPLMQRIALMRPAVDRFFDDVLVMCDPEGKDPMKTAIQQNRLALLQRLVSLFNRVADLSEIVPRGMEGR